MKIFRHYLILLITVISSRVQAQSNLTLYHMESVPQVIYANPSFKPDCNKYFGMPGFSSLDLSLSGNGIKLTQFNDAFEEIGDSGKYNLNINKLSEIFDRDIFLNMNASQDWLSFGFKLNKSFFSFNVSEKIKSRMNLPGDLFDLVINGNGGQNLGRVYDLGFGFDMLHTREYALGYQRTIMDDKLRIGGRLKYMYGITRVETERDGISFYTDPNDFTLRASTDLKVNVASILMPLDSGQEVNAMDVLYGANNHGWGLDIGVNYDLTDRINLSASLMDLGQINWNTNTRNFTTKDPNTYIEYKGVDLVQIFNDSADFEESIQALGDSLADAFQLDTTRQSFTTGLLPEFYLGGTFEMNRGNKVGVLFYGSFYNRELYPAFTLSYNARFRKILGLSLSYTAMRDNYVNLGAGMSLNLKAFQFYFITDNLGGPLDLQFNNISFRTGINFTLGRRKDELPKSNTKNG